MYAGPFRLRFAALKMTLLASVNVAIVPVVGWNWWKRQRRSFFANGNLAIRL
jgi:hypothetical protein